MKNNFYHKGISEIIIAIIIGAILAVGMFLFFRIKFPPTEIPQVTKRSEESIEEKKEEIETFSEETYKDETADWQVYTNKEYEYQIKYPKDWTYIESGRRKIFVGFLPPGTEEEKIITENGSPIYYKGDITIFVSANRDKKPIEDFYPDYFSRAEGGYNKVKVGDKLGIRFRNVKWSTGIGVDIVVIPFNTVEFGNTFLKFVGSQIKISDNLETFDKMLSTFKSIE